MSGTYSVFSFVDSRYARDRVAVMYNAIQYRGGTTTQTTNGGTVHALSDGTGMFKGRSAGRAQEVEQGG
jgi:hypothetical protein